MIAVISLCNWSACLAREHEIPKGLEPTGMRFFNDPDSLMLF